MLKFKSKPWITVAFSRAVSVYVGTTILINYIRFWDSVIELLLKTFDVGSKHYVH